MTNLAIQQNRSLMSWSIVGVAFAVLLASLVLEEGLLSLILLTVADAYIQVTSFVAATLFIFYGLERIAGIDAERLLANAKPYRQIVMAAFLGALPGCGGAIIVVTQYATGKLSFASVLAVLTATMGDAAFLLIAQEPQTGLAILALGFVVGSLTGFIVQALHAPDFMRPKKREHQIAPDVSHPDIGGWLNWVWLILFVPGLALGILAAIQVNIDAYIGTAFWPQPSVTIGAVGGILAVAMFLAPKLSKVAVSSSAVEKSFNTFAGRVISDTNFVTAWVVLAFLSFELSVYVFDVNLTRLFEGAVIFTPLIAILIGFLPGCGPQVLVTSLYLAGAIPLSAQIGNALSNDGDALFPAIAIAPKAAIVATLYSAIPAVILGYGWMIFVEGIR